MSFGEKVTFSVVSHGQSSLVGLLLSDLARLPQEKFEVIITVNVPENMSIYSQSPVPIKIIHNQTPKGFGANHNEAFRQATSGWFAVLNPDVRINSLDIDHLLEPFGDKKVATVAPVILSGDGNVEDSARKFPTFLRLLARFFIRSSRLDYSFDSSFVSVDWVAGMFMVFRVSAYKEIGGFDERRFFMYFEDVDICRRLRRNDWDIVLNSEVSVIHLAQRASRKSFKYLRWHLVSAFRYLSGI
jgi:GT2 family glycosyltransferase